MCKSSFRALTIIASVLSLGAFIAAIFASVASSPARAEIVINGAGESYCEYRSFTNENGNDTPLFKWGPCSVWGKDKLLLEGYIVVDFREQMSPTSSCSGRCR